MAQELIQTTTEVQIPRMRFWEIQSDRIWALFLQLHNELQEPYDVSVEMQWVLMLLVDLKLYPVCTNLNVVNVVNGYND